MTNKNIQNLTYQEIMETRRSEKVAISEAVREYISERQSIIISAGSTNVYVAKELAKLNYLTILTNSLNIAFEFEENQNSKVILFGGTFDPKNHVTFGEETINQLSKYRADKLIMSVDGISADHGVTIYRFEELEIYKRMIQQAKLTILAADYTKIGNEGLTRICNADAIDVLITNRVAKPEEIEKLRAIGIEVILV